EAAFPASRGGRRGRAPATAARARSGRQPVPRAGAGRAHWRQAGHRNVSIHAAKRRSRGAALVDLAPADGAAERAAARRRDERPGNARAAGDAAHRPGHRRAPGRHARSHRQHARQRLRASHRIGVPVSIQGSFQGTARSFQTTLARQPWLILAAILAMYIVLGVLYESVVHPLTILSTLPSAGVGALLALLAFRAEFTVIALIGVFLLIGLVKKNAIMMVDFALEAERRGDTRPEQAIFEACLLRFRPIMMTTMAAILGALPLVLRRGDGAELRQPLGIAIVGGLILSQLLTLYTTPVA